VQATTSSTNVLRETTSPRMEKVRAAKKSKTSTARKTARVAPHDPFTFDSVASTTGFAGLLPKQPTSEVSTISESSKYGAAYSSKSCE